MERQSSLFQFRHGDHICVFYTTEDSLLEVLTPYVAEGIIKGERCFCAQRPEVLKRVLYDLQFLGIDTDREMARGALEVHTEDEAYFPNKQFEPSAMMAMLTSAITDAQTRGFSGLRTAGEMSWATRGRNACDQVLEYEKLVEECFPGKRVIGMCQYLIPAFDSAALNAALDQHRKHLFDSNPRSKYSSLHVRHDSFQVEIVANRNTPDAPYHYVVQRHHQQIVGWGVATSFDGATAEAEQVLKSITASVSAIDFGSASIRRDVARS